MAEGPERGIDYSTKGAAVGASLHSFGLFQDARARMPMLHRWSVTGSPSHSAAAPIKRRAVGGLGWICPHRKKNFRRAARGSALASSANYLCGLLLAATLVHLAANRARVRWARMLGLPVMWIVLLSSLSLLFSPSPSLLPLPSDHQQGAVDFQGANACGLLPNSQTRIEPTFALLSLATIDFPAPNFLVLR